MCLVSDEVLRGDELGKIDFGQVPEGIDKLQVYEERVVTQLKVLKRESGVADAVDADITGMRIGPMLYGTAGAMLRCGNLELNGRLSGHCDQAALRSVSGFAE